MKVFISWSGQVSHMVAKELAEWLNVVESSLETFVSSEEISKGSVWFNDISTHLKDCAFGIVVLTPENLQSPWINFESGALFRGLTETRVVPFLVGVRNSSLTSGPLAMFQTVTSERTQVFELVRQVNRCLSHNRTDSQLARIFDRLWPELEVVLNKATSRIETERDGQSASEHQSIISFAKSQWELASLSMGIPNVVMSAKELRISGCTFKTFCDDSRNLDGICRLVNSQASVRLLMLHPQGNGVGMLATMRKDYAPRLTEGRLIAEIEMSLERLLDVLGREVVKTVVKLYRALPRYGLCISDKYLIATLYLHGHGASSPSFVTTVDNPQTKVFCDALASGFDTAWASHLSEAPTFDEI